VILLYIRFSSSYSSSLVPFSSSFGLSSFSWFYDLIEARFVQSELRLRFVSLLLCFDCTFTLWSTVFFFLDSVSLGAMEPTLPFPNPANPTPPTLTNHYENPYYFHNSDHAGLKLVTDRLTSGADIIHKSSCFASTFPISSITASPPIVLCRQEDEAELLMISGEVLCHSFWSFLSLFFVYLSPQYLVILLFASLSFSSVLSRRRRLSLYFTSSSLSLSLSLCFSSSSISPSLSLFFVVCLCCEWRTQKPLF